MSAPHHDGTLVRHGCYSTPRGDREVVSVLNPDTGHFVVVDAFEEPQAGDLDARVVDDRLETPAEVEALVADYVPRATRYAGPLSR
jgi:hypothetical protein